MCIAAHVEVTGSTHTTTLGKEDLEALERIQRSADRRRWRVEREWPTFRIQPPRPPLPPPLRQKPRAGARPEPADSVAVYTL